MPQTVAEHVETAPVIRVAQVAGLVEIGDVADLRVLEPPLFGGRRGPADFERPEQRCEIA
jgi:hypothetical protein